MAHKSLPNTTFGSASWLKLADVLSRLASPPDEVLAWERLLRLLKTGAIPARADILEEVIADYDPDITSGGEVPATVWAHMTHAQVLDVGAGTVELRGTVPDDNRPWEIIIHGMAIKGASIDKFLFPSSSPPPRSPGRPLGSFWPAFAEELAVFAYEDNIQDPTATVSLVTERVLDRMAERGEETPHPNSVRAVIAKVLGRVRT